MAGLAAWLESFPNPQGYQRPNLRLVNLLSRAGEPMLADHALAALRSLADPPAPAPPPPRLHSEITG